MTTIRAVTEQDLPLSEQRVLIEALKTWKSAGVTEPLIPSEVDADGDGKADAYGLNGFGQLVFVTGVALEDTVYTVEGDGSDG